MLEEDKEQIDDCCIDDLKPYSSSLPKSQSHQILNSEPLWKRAPTRDVNGRPYNDFMMIIPGLKKAGPQKLQQIVAKIESVLKGYEKDIVLADLNLKLNILWVTVQPHAGLTSEIAAFIHHVIPEAKLVAQHHE